MEIKAMHSDMISYKGITKSLKNRIFTDGQKDIEALIDRQRIKNPNKNLNVGQLPEYIFKKLPKNSEERVGAIKEILSVFDKVTEILRDYVYEGSVFIFDETKRNCPDYVNKMLTDVFHKYNIIKSYDEIELLWLGKGGRGKAYKIQGIYDRENEDEYVLKVFHQLKGADWHPFKSHGCYAELNSAMYWREHEGMDTHRGKFYFGSLDSGYMVTKFLDEDTRLPNRIVDEYRYGIKCTDEKKYKTKTSYEQDYNYVKDYNFDYGGMRVVNSIKNGNKIARTTLEKIKKLTLEERRTFWAEKFNERENREDKTSGLALGIKYMPNRLFYINKCLELKEPKVNRALSYVLKYLPYEDALKYFEILFQTDDKITQIILQNEIPLLAKHKAGTLEMHDDINAVLGEIIPERIYDYYQIAEKYAMPETIEHLASFVHLLPANRVKMQYRKLTNIRNEALQERLLWKFNFLTEEMQEYAAVRLAETITAPDLQEKLLERINKRKTELYNAVLAKVQENRLKQEIL